MLRMRCLIGTLILVYCSIVSAIPIDNGVEGDPEIECGPNTITVNFNTRNNFEGHVFVKGRYGEAGCRTDQSGKKTASISLPFSTCGVERQRSLNPKGIFIGVSVVITFHPQFLTKVDRAYSVQCFYMEADKTVSQDIEVSEITTAFQTQNVPMPVCRYDILDGGPNGEPLKFGVIGQQVYHKWTCETESVDIFCMLVHSCSIDDASGSKIQVVNEQGCALDKYVLNNLEYISDLMAGKEAHIVKFADKPALFFQCQISISIKEPGEDCPRPKCPEPGGLGGAIPPGTVPPSSASTPSSGGGGAGVKSPTSPRIPPSRPASATPRTPTTPNPGSSPRAKSSPSAVPPSYSRQPTPPVRALAVLANAGKPLPAPGSLLPLSPSLITRKPFQLSSTSHPLSSSTPGRGILQPAAPQPFQQSLITSRASTSSSTHSTSSSHPTTLGPLAPVIPRLPSEIQSPSRPGIGAPGPIAPPSPPLSPPAPFLNSVNLPSVTSQPAPIANLAQARPNPPPAGLQPPPPPPFLPISPPNANVGNSSRPPTNASARFDFESTFPFRIRRVRSVDRADFIGTWDVRAPMVNTYEDFEHELASGRLDGVRRQPSPLSLASTSSEATDHLYCVPTVLIGLVIGVTLLSFLASIVVALFVCLRRREARYYVD